MTDIIDINTFEDSVTVFLKERIEETIKCIRVPLNQMCYIVPNVILLSTFFKIEYYYTIDETSYTNGPCYKNLLTHGMISESNLIKITKNDFNDLVRNDYLTYGTSILYYVNGSRDIYPPDVLNILKKVGFSISHGIDEESYLKTNVFREDVLSYHILRAQAGLTQGMMDKIYKIDKNKKTILFEDTSLTFCHKLSPGDTVLQSYQNNMFNDLIKLKNDYNVVIRFHPQYYHFLERGDNVVAQIIRDNFIVDYTQICLTDQYDEADIVIFSRVTSSGYQSIFHLNKNMVLIDLDIDSRKNAILTKYWLINEKDNKYVDDLMKEKKILHDELVHICNEKDVKLYDIVKNIEKNNYIVSVDVIEKRKQFIEKNFKISVDCDHNDKLSKIYTILFALAQIPEHHKIVKEVFDRIKLSHDENTIKSLNKTRKIMEQRFKIK